MPELPEVQTIISDLNKRIKGDTVTGFWSNHKKAIKNNFDSFRKGIKGRKILGAERIGKNIFINLSGGKTIYIHLKMTGHLLVVKRETHNVKREEKKNYFKDRVNQYVHHIFYLEENKKMEFSDLRKFGKVILVDTNKVKELKEIKNLGVDAMTPEFTLKKFQEILNKKGEKKIRDILMDQNIISGIGNIYASEILFDAKVLPARKFSQLKKTEIKAIFNSIKKVFNKAIRLRGTSDSDYRDTSGAPGNFQKVLKVYQRAGKKCAKCGTIVKRIKMGQRSAFICPKCQK